MVSWSRTEIERAFWVNRARLERVIDGDTVVLTVDNGFGSRAEEHIRLVGVSAPELSEPGGVECREFTWRWLTVGLMPLRWPLVVETTPNTNPEPTERRSLVRYLGAVQRLDTLGSLNADLAAFLTAHPEWGTGQ